MPESSIRVDGLRPMLARLRALGQAGVTIAGRAVRDEAEAVMTTAKEKYIPVESGTLRASGHVKAPVIRGHTIVTEIAFGGPSAGYAIYVHEIPSPIATHGAEFNAKHGGGVSRGVDQQWKYLEKPLMEAAPDFPRKIRDRIAASLSVSA
mgnify:CR=1 FL=1